MKQELYQLYNGELSTILTADEGMMIVRNADGMRIGEQVYLGYKFVNGEAVMEMPSDFHQEPFVEEEETAVEQEPTAKEILAKVKANKIDALNAYDNSEAVNGFYIGENVAWIDAETRSQYKTSIEAAELLGEEDITFAINNAAMTLPIQSAKMMLAQVQRYADACYLVTMQHKSVIEAMSTVEGVEAYDFTQGYPEKLSFSL